MNSKGLVVITGATSGIGEACSFTFSQAGYSLLLIGRRKDRLKDLTFKNSICVQGDVTNYDLFRDAIERAENKFGPVKCIINNAGILFLARLIEQDPNEWKEMLNTNVLGVLNGIKSVLSSMIKNKQGTIINISSVAGTKNYPHHDVYCGTKFAVSAITEGLRAEVAKYGIRCISICPGVVETEILNYTSHEELRKEYQVGKQNMGKTITAQELAQIILYAYEQPQHVCIRELIVCPTGQER